MEPFVTFAIGFFAGIIATAIVTSMGMKRGTSSGEGANPAPKVQLRMAEDAQRC